MSEVTINFKHLVDVWDMEIDKNTIILTDECFCKRPYPGHLKGCYKYNSKLCPPNVDKIKLDEYNKFYIIYAVFDFKSYKILRKKDHPDWTERQVANLYFWQNSVRGILKNNMKEVYKRSIYDLFGCGSGFWHNPSMEAVGINVFSTMRLNGIKLDIHPTNTIYLVCLLCVCKNKIGDLL